MNNRSEGKDKEDYGDLSSASTAQKSRQRTAKHRRVLSRTPSLPVLRRTSSYGTYQAIAPRKTSQLILPTAKESRTRWLVLAFSCLLLFGNYYAYDIPAALNLSLQEYFGHDYNTWQYELSLLYSVYSFPNMFLPLISGLLIDYFPTELILIILSIIVCLGQTLIAFGISIKSYPLALIGRVLFGIGGESIGVVQASITSSWFKNKEQAFALGLNLCVSRLGSVANSNLTPRIGQSLGVPAAGWFGAISCYISLFSCFILSTLIYRHKQSLKPLSLDEAHPSDASLPDETETRRLSFRDLDEGGRKGDKATSPIYLQKSPASSRSSTLALLNDGDYLEEPMPSSPTPLKRQPSSVFSDIKYLPWSFWILCGICVCLYGTVIPFNNIASDFFVSKWFPGDVIKAGQMMSIPDAISTGLVPIMGYIVDRFGGRASLLLYCSIILGAVHLTLGLTSVYPLIPMLALGLSYCIYGVAIWPSIAVVIQHQEEKLERTLADRPQDMPKLLGTAYGLATSFMNTAFTIFPLFIAGIRTHSEGFVEVELFFATLACVGFVLSILLMLWDYYEEDSVLQHQHQEAATSLDGGIESDQKEEDEDGLMDSESDESNDETEHGANR